MHHQGFGHSHCDVAGVANSTRAPDFAAARGNKASIRVHRAKLEPPHGDVDVAAIAGRGPVEVCERARADARANQSQYVGDDRDISARGAGADVTVKIVWFSR